MSEDSIELVMGAKKEGRDGDDDDGEDNLGNDNTKITMLENDDDDVAGGDDDDYKVDKGSAVGILGVLKPADKEPDPTKIPPNQRVTFRENPKLKIDFVLTYKPAEDDKEGNKKAMRESYEENLADFGIMIEREQAAKDSFVMLHCPFDTLCKGAQMMKLKKPIRKQGEQKKDEPKGGVMMLWKKLSGGRKMLIHQPFNNKRREQFLIKNEDTFFTSAERNYIIYSIMERTMFKNENKVQTGLGCLLGHDAYASAYPLHDPTPHKSEGGATGLSERERLYNNWVRPKNVFRSQPLDDIKSYFGEQFTFYFAWMSVYTGSLFVAAIAGLACFIYGVASFSTIDTSVKEICDPDNAPGNFTMCPKCDSRCNYSLLHNACNTAKFTRVFDNEATLACAVFICVWAICFIEFWKRKQLALQHEWNVVDFEADENVRPEFVNQTNKLKKNPWSGVEEPVVSFLSKVGRTMTSISVLLFLLSLVVIAIFAVLVYRLALVYALYQHENIVLKHNAKIITTITAALLNVLAISILGFIYQKLAQILTNLEAHKTRTAYEDSFIFKIVVFQCINNYGSIVYIAFFKGSFVDRPGYKNLYMFGTYKQDECDDAGCFSELTIQLIIVMIGKQFLNALIEMLAPIFKKLFRARDNKDKSKYMQWEKDLDLECHPPISMFGEYLEMVIQYGFVVLFVVAFPLAPLFAFINNVIEIRLDAYKMVKLFRRCPALKAQDIGAWQFSLQMISYLAVITNAFIIAWTSDFIPKMVYRYSPNTKGLAGYVNWTLATFNVSEFKPEQRPSPEAFPQSVNVTECKYKTFSAPPNEISDEHIAYYWQLHCARWAFVIVFEHFAFLLMSLAKMIPETTEEVRLKVEYEKAILNNVEVDDLFSQVKERKGILNIPMLQGISGSRIGFSNAVQE